MQEALINALAEEFAFPWHIQGEVIIGRPSFDNPGPVVVIKVDESDDGCVIDINFLFYGEDSKPLILFDTATHSALEIIRKIQNEQLVYSALNDKKDTSTGQEGRAITLRRAAQLLEEDVGHEGLSEEANDRLISDLAVLLNEADCVFAEIGLYVSGQGNSSEAFSLLHIRPLGTA